MIEDDLNAYLRAAGRYAQCQADLIRYWHQSDRNREDPQVRILVQERDETKSKLRDIERRFVPILKFIPGGMKRKDGIKFVPMHSIRGW